jgi:diguanylate cyclase (GGDEF)-like protein
MLISHNANYKVLRESLVLRAENSQLIHSLKEMNASLESKVAERVQDIKRIAHRDSLTDLPNRRGLMEWMERNLNPAAKHEAAVLFLDLDQFKEINDAMGHDIGDQVLQLVALRFKRCLPKNSILARWGGDEFVIVVAADEQVRYTTEVLAHLLIQAAEAPLEIEGEHMAIGLSVVSLITHQMQKTSRILSMQRISPWQKPSVWVTDRYWYLTKLLQKPSAIALI